MNASTETASIEPGTHRSSMDRMYRLQRHIYDATRAYYLLGRDKMLQDLSPSPGDLVLEIGCGTGRNLVKAASLYPECRFFGVDISDEMLKTATAKIASVTPNPRISLWQGDATALTAHPGLSQHRFDRIYISYALSMIPEWQSALASAAALLSPTGRLHLVDFGPCSGLPRFFKASLRKWLSTFGVTPRDAIAQAIIDCSLSETFTPTLEFSHRGYATHVTLVRRD